MELDFNTYLRDGLAKTAFYYYSTYGLTLDVFNDYLKGLKTYGDLVALIERHRKLWS